MLQSVRLSSCRVYWHPKGATLVSNDKGIATMLVDEIEALEELAKGVGLAEIPRVVALARPAAPGGVQESLPWEEEDNG